MRRRVGSARAAKVRFNWADEYLTIWLNIKRLIDQSKSFFRVFSKKSVDRVDRGHNWQSRNRKQRAEDERFDREFQMIFLREEISREVTDRAARCRLWRRFVCADCSLDLYHAHESS